MLTSLSLATHMYKRAQQIKKELIAYFFNWGMIIIAIARGPARVGLVCQHVQNSNLYMALYTSWHLKTVWWIRNTHWWISRRVPRGKRNHYPSYFIYKNGILRCISLLTRPGCHLVQCLPVLPPIEEILFPVSLAHEAPSQLYSQINKGKKWTD
jgi:hypothetical protein